MVFDKKVTLLNDNLLGEAYYLAIIVAATAFGFFNKSYETLVFLTLIAFIGIPHGAQDLPEIFKYKSWKVILFFYLLATVFLPLLFFVDSKVWFITFLTLSIFHFSVSDMKLKSIKKIDNLFELLFRSTIIFSGPTVLYSDQLNAYFQIFLNDQLFINKSIAFLTWLFPFSICTLVASFFIRLVIEKKYENKDNLELFILLTVFVTLPFLLAFSLYFCFIHSIHHIKRDMRFYDKTYLFLVFLATVLVISVVTLFVLFNGSLFVINQDLLIKYTIIAISGVTLPHMIFLEVKKGLK